MWIKIGTAARATAEAAIQEWTNGNVGIPQSSPLAVE